MIYQDQMKDIEKVIVARVESFGDLNLKLFYTETAAENKNGDLKVEEHRSLYFKELSSDISLCITFTESFMSAAVIKSNKKEFVSFNSYLKNNDREDLLRSTKHWDGQQWVTDKDKYLSLIFDLVNNEFKPVLKGETWIEDYVDLDKYVQGKK